jgi:hypothetical protein
VKPKLTEVLTSSQFELYEVSRHASPETSDCNLIDVVFKEVGGGG